MDVTAYANTAIKYRKELLLQLALGLNPILDHFTLNINVQDELAIGSLDGAFELRPHDGNVNKQDPLSLSKRILKVYVGDVVTEEAPETLRSTIFGAQLTETNKEPSKHPLEAQIIAKIINGVSNSLMKALFKAERNAAGTTTMDLFSGFDTLTATEITAGNISVANGNYENVGAIDENNAVQTLKDFYFAASDELQGKMSKLYVSKAIYNAYNQNYQDDNGALPYNTEFKKTFLEGSDNLCELVPLVSKASSNYIHLSVKSNMNIGMDQESDKEYVKVREIDNPFKAQFVLKAAFGVQFSSVHKFDLKVGQVASSGSASA